MTNAPTPRDPELLPEFDDPTPPKRCQLSVHGAFPGARPATVNDLRACLEAMSPEVWKEVVGATSPGGFAIDLSEHNRICDPLRARISELEAEAEGLRETVSLQVAEIKKQDRVISAAIKALGIDGITATVEQLPERVKLVRERLDQAEADLVRAREVAKNDRVHAMNANAAAKRYQTDRDAARDAKLLRELADALETSAGSLHHMTPVEQAEDLRRRATQGETHPADPEEKRCEP